MLALMATYSVARIADDLGRATGSRPPDIGTPLDQTSNSLTVSLII
jgi:hypothetical protein